MNIPFDQYVAARVPKLRKQAADLSAEADALERALKDYEKEKEPAIAAPRTFAGGGTPLRLPTQLRPAKIQEGSQTDLVIKCLREKGPVGARMQDIYRRLSEFGVSNEASIRSVVWNLKKAGKVVAVADCYYLPELAPKSDENGGQQS